MKKLNYLIAVLVMAILLPSCNQISKLAESASGGLSMDSEGAAADIVECLGKIDQNQWRVLSLTIRADGSQDECSNTLGNIYAYMINSDDQIVFQNLWPNVTAPEPKGGNFYKNKKFSRKFLRKKQGAVTRLKPFRAMLYPYPAEGAAARGRGPLQILRTKEG